MSLPEDLGIVVVNYGPPDLLEANLVQLGRRLTTGRVVVVDNFSTLAHREATTALAAREGWSLIAPGLNLGFGAGVNAGARLLISRGCSRLLLINPDARIDEAGVLALATACAANPQQLQSPRIVRPDGSLWFAGGTVDVGRGRTRTGDPVDSSAPGGWLSGSCLMVHAHLWDWLGGFDETYFLYWEDVDLSWRCLAAGGTLLVRDDITVVHSVGGTQDTSGKSPLYVYSNCRNRLAFAARHLDRRHVMRWLLLSPVYAAAVLQRGGRRDLARHAVPLLMAAARGTVAGAGLAMRTLIAPAPANRPAVIRRLNPVREDS
ncbi:glycosyltransferase family 2 protein [Cryobacterium arcticum]|uniref:Glycosyltransferase family 2 protein n=1 Tax=Cryobacterium arcticum TaxID=670052 RepID=A0A317ZJR2_9MICO|nr:glycosyltransferase family 2 protein [Cryobacterium arcticum]PXA65704.1 glycosyltransferase family 2 protein [Cryobacterium arcticum]